MQRESALEIRVVKDATKKLGVYSTKMGSLGNTGFPDRVFFLPNSRILMIEFKAPGGKLSAKQRYIHARLAESGHYVAVCDEYEDAMEQIRTAAWNADYHV